jgi:hypothetical protein
LPERAPPMTKVSFGTLDMIHTIRRKRLDAKQD